MKIQRQFLLMVLLAIFALVPFSSASAEQFIANITLKQGERTRLNLSSAYQSIMTSYGSGLPYSWWSDNSNICTATSFHSKIYCEIFGNSVGTTEIHYKGEYWSGSNIIEYTCYWFVNVEPGEGGGGGGVTPSSDDDYTLPEESWGDVGNYTISWYNKNQTEFTISTNKELAGMAYLVNNQYTDFEGKTIKLANDIDISGKKWVSFSTFKGILDGQGYCINGFAAENGLIGKMDKATIKNITLQGYVFLNEPKTEKNVPFTVEIGGLAGVAYESTIERCQCKVNIIYRRTKALGNGNYPKDVYIGGLVGCAGNGFDPMYIRYCTYDGEIKCRLYDEPIHIGGISGESNKLAQIEYCENNASIISVETERTLSNSDYHPIIICGINGGAPSSYNVPDIVCCRSICSISFKHIESVNSYYNSFGIQGIGKGKAVNCYSVIPSIAVSAYSPCELRYNGIGEEQVKGNYSNSDVDFQTTINIQKSYSGSTAFSSAQMQTPAFLEELNMYPTLEMDGPVWTQEEGGFPYIAELHKSCLKGDVNDDGTVDIADAVCIVNHVVSKPNTTFVEAAADANGDGEVDIADAVKIVNLVVGKIDALSRPAKEVNDEKEPQKNSVKKETK